MSVPEMLEISKDSIRLGGSIESIFPSRFRVPILFSSRLVTRCASS